MEQQKDTPYSLNETYLRINEHMSKVHRFIALEHVSFKTLIDYGCGPAIAMMEVHTLSEIATHPGITTSEIRGLWGNRPSLSAMSQNVNKLLKKGLIYQKKFENDDKRKALYTTALGEELHRAHVRYDIADEEMTMGYLRQYATEDEIKAFFKVVDLWVNMRMEKRNKACGETPCAK